MHIFVKSQTIPKVRRETVTTNETFTASPVGKYPVLVGGGRPMQTINRAAAASPKWTGRGKESPGCLDVSFLTGKKKKERN